MSETTKTAPTCPGCHIGCSLTSYQCCRGKRLYGQWRAGEPIPERRPLWKRREGEGVADGIRVPHGAPARATAETEAEAAAAAETATSPVSDGEQGARRPAMPPAARLMHMLNIASIAFSKHKETRPERLTIDTIARHEGCAAAPIIRNRTQLAKDEIAALVSELAEAGLLEERHDEIAGTMYGLTAEGQAHAEEWRSEREAADAAFVDALTADEQAQLAELISKMLGSSGVRMRR